MKSGSRFGGSAPGDQGTKGGIAHLDFLAKLILTQRSRRFMSNEPVRIALDPEVLAGKPVVRGTRLSVEFVIGLMADGWSEADILANYPG